MTKHKATQTIIAQGNVTIIGDNANGVTVGDGHGDAQAPSPTLHLRTRLDGRHLVMLQDALCDAFSLDALKQVVRYGLDEDLEVIAGTGATRTVVFNLIDWARKTSKLDSLIQAAVAANPTNEQLRAFVQNYCGEAA